MRRYSSRDPRWVKVEPCVVDPVDRVARGVGVAPGPRGMTSSPAFATTRFSTQVL